MRCPHKEFAEARKKELAATDKGSFYEQKQLWPDEFESEIKSASARKLLVYGHMETGEAANKKNISMTLKGRPNFKLLIKNALNVE